MNELECGGVREFIPDVVRGPVRTEDADVVQAHVASCDACRAELELAMALFASRAEVPEGLADRVILAARSDRRAVRSEGRAQRPWWGVSAAAIAALALGIGISSEPTSTLDPEVPGYAYEVEEGELWSSDDALVAGAPMLDELTDEALEQLLDELMVGSSGGAA